MKKSSHSILLPGKVRRGCLDISEQLAGANITGDLVEPVIELVQPKIAQAINDLLTPKELSKVRDEATVSFHKELTALRQKLALAEAAAKASAAKGSDA